jgi:hypothetical protein
MILAYKKLAALRSRDRQTDAHTHKKVSLSLVNALFLLNNIVMAVHFYFFQNHMFSFLWFLVFIYVAIFVLFSTHMQFSLTVLLWMSCRLYLRRYVWHISPVTAHCLFIQVVYLGSFAISIYFHCYCNTDARVICLEEHT